MPFESSSLAASPRRVIVEVEPAKAATYVHGDDDDDRFAPRMRAWTRACTLEEVAERLGITRQRVEQIETVALEKIKLAFELEARIGARRAVKVLIGLRGKPLVTFRATLAMYETSLPMGDSDKKGPSQSWVSSA